MTCFWNSILQTLDKEDLKLIGLEPTNRKNIRLFIQKLKTIALDNDFDILWQDNELTEIEKNEFKTFIKDYNISGIQNGHLTSSCDPFLCLLTDKLKWKIELRYCNHKIIFQSKNNIRKTIHFRANRGHFSKG
jgi:hypothetical protein